LIAGLNSDSWKELFFAFFAPFCGELFFFVSPRLFKAHNESDTHRIKYRSTHPTKERHWNSGVGRGETHQPGWSEYRI